ncbi:hypothetical protein V494_04630, partial [Pseudogymnoascus sp. VKM F-4513 (FW-928)]
MRRPSIRKIIPIHTRQHHIPEPPPLQRLRRILRLMRIQRRHIPRPLRLARRLDRTESAAPRTRIAHEHNRRRRARLVRSAPALPDVGTPRLFAHGVQPQTAQVGFDGFETGGGVGGGDGGLEPAGETGDFFFADFGGAGPEGEHFGGGEGLVDVE